MGEEEGGETSQEMGKECCSLQTQVLTLFYSLPSADGVRDSGGVAYYGRTWSEPASRRSSQGYPNVSVVLREESFFILIWGLLVPSKYARKYNLYLFVF